VGGAEKSRAEQSRASKRGMQGRAERRAEKSRAEQASKRGRVHSCRQVHSLSSWVVPPATLGHTGGDKLPVAPCRAGAFP